MKTVHIAIAADHRGFAAKEILRLHKLFGDYEVIWHDYGTFSQERTDYPPFAFKVVRAIRQNEVTYGVLLCGSGAGMAIAANRAPGIYAAVAWNPAVAQVCREEDHANVLSIPTDYVADADLVPIITAWLASSAKGGRYLDRLNMIESQDLSLG